MRKLKLLLTCFLLILFTPTAFSAQIAIRSQTNPSELSYLSTAKKVYTTQGWVYKFNTDGISNYPNEIYLPNETNPEQYRVHTSYTKNTDACASCHATHTGVGPALVQWYSNYETCLACHDGSVSTTYNVVEGIIPRSNQWTSGGLFGTGKEQFLSYHNVTGGVQIGAAPNSDINASGTKFDMPMGCESCHSPHGMGGNARILSPDPNGIQLQHEDRYKEYQLLQIGFDGNGASVVFVAYPKNEIGEFDISKDPYYMLKGYPYPLNIYEIRDNAKIPLENIVDNTYGYTRIKIPVALVTSNIYADFVPSLRVTMKVQNYLAIGENGKTVKEMVYYKTGSEEFCRSCHNSYGSTQNPNSDERLDNFTHKHPVGMSVDNARIQINTNAEVYTGVLKDKFEENDKIVCLTCHAPHGVDQDYWLKTVGFGSNDPSESSFSSCLKRSPNGSLCLTCHPWDLSGEGYLTNTGQEKFEPQLTTQLSLLGNQPLDIASFVGSNEEKCSGLCHHKPIVNGWKATTHEQTLRDNSTIVADAKPDFFNQTLISITQVVYVVGTKDSQRYIYIQDGIFKVTKNEYDIQHKKWIPKAAVNDFINNCAGCHVTGLDVTKNTWTDDGVACEACHGAASNHILFPKSRNITNPRYLEIKDQSDICAQCHALGASSVGGVSRPFPVGYVPHQAALLSSVYHDEYQLNAFFTIYDAKDKPANFYKSNADGKWDSYYSAQEFNDFVQSKHYESNVISCVTCHSSHSTNWKGQLLKGTFEQICGACHDNSFNINEVMPSKAIYPASENTFRVHTFSKTHTALDAGVGSPTLIH